MNVMKKSNILLFSFIVVALTACVDIYKGPESIYDQELEVVLKPSMQGWSDEETLPEGMRAGLFVDAPGGGLSQQSVYPGLFNLELKMDAEGSLKSSTALYYPEEGNKFDFILYSPHRDLGENTTIEFASASEAASLLYSGNLRGKYKSLSVLKPVFKHAAAKIVLNLQAGVGVTEDEIISSEIMLTNATTSGTFNLSDGSFVPDGDKSEIDFVISGLNAECLVLPTAADAKETSALRVLIGDNAFVVRIPGQNIFEYGKCYTFDVTVSISGIEISLDEINDWVANEEGGNAELI